jgi:hypothetical protein
LCGSCCSFLGLQIGRSLCVFCLFIFLSIPLFCLSLIYRQSWLYDSWIYNYLSNRWLSPLTLWGWIPLMARYTQYNIMWFCQRLVAGLCFFSPGTPVYSINKTDRHDITKILLKVVLNTITLTPLDLRLLIILMTSSNYSYWHFVIVYITKPNNG